MADVTGEIGGQPVQLNNAATEATLKQLLQATLAMAQKQGADLSATTKLQKELAKLQKESEKNTKIQGEVNKKKQEEAKQLEAAAAARKKEEELALKSQKATDFARQSAIQFGNEILNVAGKLTSIVSSIANMGSSMTGVASVMSNVPVVGGLLSQSLGAVAGAAEKLQASFKTSSSVGATFGGSIRAMTDTASEAGLTFDQFSNVIKNNSEDLVRLGGSTTEGAKRLAGLAKTLKDTKLQDDLARLGYTSEDIANGMAKSVGNFYSGMNRGTASTAEQAKVGAEYLKNLNAISAATGKSREEMERETQRRQNDARVKAAYAGLDAKSRANMEALFNGVPPELQKAVEEIALTGTAQSKEAQYLMSMHGDVARHALEINQKVRRREVVSQEDQLAFDKTMMKEGEKVQRELRDQTGATTSVMTYVGGEAAQVGLGFAKVGERSQSVADATAKQAQELRDSAAKAAGFKDALDPAYMVNLQQQIAATSNTLQMTLAQHLPKVGEAMDMLLKVLGPITAAFDFLMNHLYTIATVAGGLIVVFGALSKFSTAFKAYQEFKALGKQPGHPGSIPLNVKEVSGGLDGDKGKGKGKGKGGAGGGKSNFGKALGVVKGAGAVGAVVGVGMLASDLSNISDREKEGTITAEQAKEERGGAIGGAAGSAGGALAGAAAGAALGSVVPVIGTVVGGVIGGLLGGFGGTKLGESIGKGVAKSTTTGTVAGSSMDAEGFGVPETVEATPAATQASVRQVDNAIAATAAKPQGSGVNYNASPEQMLKQFAKSQGVTGTVKPIPTTTGQVQTVTDQMKADAEKKAAAEAKAKEDAAKKALEEGKPPTGAPTPPAQENPATMLATLNTTMTQLLKTNRELLSISEKQLSVQRQFTGDVFTV